MKKCTICKEDKDLNDFNKDSSRFDGKDSTCKECKILRGVRYRKSGRAAEMSKRRYYTKKDYLVHKYKGMRQRVRGEHSDPKTNRIYKGLPLCGKQEFLDWAITDEAFNSIWYEWLQNGVGIKFSPSIDRIIPKKGYALSNLQFLPLSENSRKSARARHDRTD
jgi:hypothetical protein